MHHATHWRPSVAAARALANHIEKGTPAVARAAHLNVMTALGLDFSLSLPADQAAAAPAADRAGWLPAPERLLTTGLAVSSAEAVTTPTL